MIRLPVQLLAASRAALRPFVRGARCRTTTATCPHLLTESSVKTRSRAGAGSKTARRSKLAVATAVLLTTASLLFFWIGACAAREFPQIEGGRDPIDRASIVEDQVRQIRDDLAPRIEYRVLNPDDGFPVTEPRLKLNDGHLCMSYKMPALSPKRIQVPLQPISDTEAIILGLGRTRRETLRAIDVDGGERLRYSGLIGRKLETATQNTRSP